MHLFCVRFPRLGLSLRRVARRYSVGNFMLIGVGYDRERNTRWRPLPTYRRC
jgi:hypothetical protein